ncbi:MAG: polysaccharide deacetylase family protein [Planctomycetes bacterium]|nr:polysaccharide deacetylase family protein [Planctomycetota bacterium]
MGLKHSLKLGLRKSWSKIVFHTGLHRVIDALMPRRLTILAGHCVHAPSSSGLPPDMTIQAAKLQAILAWLARRYDVVTVGVGVERLEQAGKRSLVALSMDDGYKDNRTHLLPLLKSVGVSATIYLETKPLDARVPNWSHKFFAILDRMGPADFVLRFTEISTDTRSNILMNQLVSHGEVTSYHVKRMLKYEVPAVERSRAIDVMFAECELDERELTERLYMTWDDARALRDAGIELGGHTVNHEILSRLDAAGARAEIEGSRLAITRELGAAPESFAYPFGRAWDWNDETVRVARESGWKSAVTTNAGTNQRGGDVLRLKRIMIDEHADLAEIVTHVCGGFDVWRRVGVDLA